MTRVFFSSWRPVYRPAGGMLRRARRNHLLGPTGNPPSIVPGPFLAYLSPGPASTVLPYRRQDWPGPASGIDQDAGTLPSDAVVNAFSTAPFEVTFPAARRWGRHLRSACGRSGCGAKNQRRRGPKGHLLLW